MSTKNEIREEIIRLWKDSGLTRAQVARGTGCTKTTIGWYIAGKRDMSSEKASRVRRFLMQAIARRARRVIVPSL